MNIDEQGDTSNDSKRPLSPQSRTVSFDSHVNAEQSLQTSRHPLSPDTHHQHPFPPKFHDTMQSSLKSKPQVVSLNSKHLSTSSRPQLPLNMLPSAPASPPTPAPSPTPFQRAPTWQSAGEDEDTFLRDVRARFLDMSYAEKQRLLAELLNMCDSNLLSFVSHFVSPRLKKDPFEHLPDEICIKVLSFLDDPRSLARASQVSHRWHKLLNDDCLWKMMCDKHAYRRMPMPIGDKGETSPISDPPFHPYNLSNRMAKRDAEGLLAGPSSSAPNLSIPQIDPVSRPRSRKRPQSQSHYSHFRHKYMIEAAWRKGGESIVKHITPDQGVVTSLHLTDKYIVVAMDNAKIHVFNTVGEHQKTLKGHVMGVWAMIPWEDTLVSGGCDRDVRVWDMSTGRSIWTLRGHTSTVRCLKMSDAYTAISGSRDTTLRVWDLTTGTCKNVLVGHQASVRCLAVHGDLVVSGSYDTTARIWSISEGRCLKTLSGHFSQIYAIAFDGERVATGSLDTSVRVWDPQTGNCTAVLQGHTSLVGQLQMRGDTLVTGGSDGSVRVWSLRKAAAIHRLAAHDNSVTSLQFDDNRIVSGGSDGRVKIWSVETGQLVRELSTPAEAVWRVSFEEEKAVIMASRNGRTVMEVWSFSPKPSHAGSFRSSLPFDSTEHLNHLMNPEPEKQDFAQAGPSNTNTDIIMDDIP